MFGYLKKFNDLPKELKDKISNPTILSVIDALEEKYKVELAGLVMRVMVKEVSFKDLGLTLASESGVNGETAEKIITDLKNKVFYVVADYLGLGEEIKINNENNNKIKNSAAEIIAGAKIKINKDLENRLINILNLYLRGVRSKIDTRQFLQKKISLGGLELDEISTNKLINLADGNLISNNNATTHAPINPAPSVLDKINRLSAGSSHYEVYDLKKSLDIAHELKSGIDLSHELAAPKARPEITPVMPVSPSGFSNQAIKTTPTKSTLIPEAPKFRTYVPPTPPVKMELSPSAKNKINDIQTIKIMNPIDELRYMDLINFRRLAKDPEEITKKIKARLDYLATEDFEKKLAGIAAWRQSPVNKIYIKIINISFSQGWPVAAVLNDLKEKKQETLTMEEFDAIVDLNNELKF